MSGRGNPLGTKELPSGGTNGQHLVKDTSEPTGNKWDDQAATHSHSNKSILDGDTASYTTEEETKLSGIEALSEVNQTDAEIKTQYENNANTNSFTDAEKSKVAGLESSKFLGEFVSLGALQTAHPSPIVGSYANVDTGVAQDVVRYIWDDDDSIYVLQLGVSTVLTDAQIKTQYENNPDTNAFTDSEQSDVSTNTAKVSNANHTGDVTGSAALTIADNAVTLAKMADMPTASLLGRNTAATGDPEVLPAATARTLLNVEDGATADQSDSEIKTAYENNANTNVYTDSEKTKLGSLTGGRYLGVFADLTALQTAHATGVSGDSATVTSPNGNLFYWNVSSWADSGTGFIGDMNKATFDPTAKNTDAFNMDNMDESATKKVLTNTERSEISANTTHKSSDGSDHDFLDQDVTTTGTPTFNTTKLNPITAPAHDPGTLFYDSDGDELAFYNSEVNVKLNIGTEIWVKVRNNSGATINDFTPVYQTGAVGNRATIALAKADSSATSEVIGITTHQIENNSNGFVTVLGTINGVDTDGSPFTETWNDGNEIFLSATIAGGFTNVMPTGNNIVKSMGNVLTANNNGSFHTHLNGSNVTGASSSADNAIVRFDGTSGKRIKEGAGISASEISIATGAGSPTIDQVQEYLNNTGSSGFFLGGVLSDGGAGTLNVAAGSGFIRTTNDPNAELQSFKWSESLGIAVTDDTTQYVYVDYLGVISLSIDEFLETPNKIQIGVVTKEGGVVEHVFSLGVRLQESIGQAGRFIRRVFGLSRDKRKGGLIFGQSGDANRDVTMTAGIIWWGRTEYTIPSFDTSGADTFSTYSASGQESAADSQWNNLQYDNVGTLTTLANNRWANLFFFIEPDDHIVMVYGRAQHNSEEAADQEAVPSSSLPSKISETSLLAARFTFQKSSNIATIASAFDQLFANAGVADHGDLAGLGDDDHPQYLLLDGRSSDITIVPGATYTVLATDRLIHTTYTPTGPITSITIPTALLSAGKKFVIVDGGGNAGTNNITIDTEGAETIIGQATYVMSTNYESKTFYSDGSNWFFE